MDSIRNGARSYFRRRTNPEQMSSSPRLSLFSVFISHVIKTKNRNRSINKFKNLGYDR